MSPRPVLALAIPLAAGLLLTAPSGPPAGAGPPVAARTADAATTNAPAAGTAGTTAAYRPPLDPATLLRRFDPPAQRWSAGHRGVDLAAAPGTSVLAPGHGVVAFAGPVVARDVLTIDHPDGLRSSLEPVTSALVPGFTVAAGEVVGAVADQPSHCGAPGACLHWGVRRGSAYLDPLGLLPGAGPVVLLPAP